MSCLERMTKSENQLNGLNHNMMSDNQLASLGMSRCPFNASHTVKNSRFQIHVTRCERIMNTDQKWKCCHFNADHWIKAELFDSHLLECPDTRQLIRQSMEATDEKRNQVLSLLNAKKLNRISGNESKDEIQIKEEFEVKTEMELNGWKESKEKFAVKVTERDEWLDPLRTEFVSVYGQQVIKAEDLMEEEYYIDPAVMTRLSKAERKRLNEMKVKAIREKPESSRDPNSRFVLGHFKPTASVTIREKERYVTEFDIKPFIGGMTDVKVPEDILSASVIRKRLHSVQKPFDWKGLAETEAKTRTENSDSIIGRRLRSLNLSDKDLVEIEILVDKPLRRPKSGPFDGRLRRPAPLNTIKAEKNTK